MLRNAMTDDTKRVTNYSMRTKIMIIVEVVRTELTIGANPIVLVRRLTIDKTEKETFIVSRKLEGYNTYSIEGSGYIVIVASANHKIEMVYARNIANRYYTYTNGFLDLREYEERFQSWGMLR